MLDLLRAGNLMGELYSMASPLRSSAATDWRR